MYFGADPPWSGSSASGWGCSASSGMKYDETQAGCRTKARMYLIYHVRVVVRPSEFRTRLARLAAWGRKSVRQPRVSQRGLRKHSKQVRAHGQRHHGALGRRRLQRVRLLQGHLGQEQARLSLAVSNGVRRAQMRPRLNTMKLWGIVAKLTALCAEVTEKAGPGHQVFRGVGI